MSKADLIYPKPFSQDSDPRSRLNQYQYRKSPKGGLRTGVRVEYLVNGFWQHLDGKHPARLAMYAKYGHKQ